MCAGTARPWLHDATIGDYTNITTIGLQLVAVVAAHAAGLVAAPEAVTRLDQTLTTLERLETFAGFFYNYYDTTSLERTSHYSLVRRSGLAHGRPDRGAERVSCPRPALYPGSLPRTITGGFSIPSMR